MQTSLRLITLLDLFTEVATSGFTFYSINIAKVASRTPARNCSKSVLHKGWPFTVAANVRFGSKADHDRIFE